MSVVKKIIRDFGDFSLDIHDWEILDQDITVLWGASGSGKSTVIRCLLGLDPKADVSWFFAETDIAKLPVWQRNLAVVFQDLALFPHMSARQNILFALKKSYDQEENKFRRIVSAMDIENLLDRSVGKLSGGERQRVALARALIYQPRLLMMDEPFSSLDEVVRDQARNLVKEITQEFKIPVLLITHDRQDVAQLAKRVFHLRAGQIVGEAIGCRLSTKALKGGSSQPGGPMSAPTPIALSHELHPNPTQDPQFSTSIQNKAGESVTLACPAATRALVALMDMEAVIGGAASHFGGPAAFAESMSALHGFMFRHSGNMGKQWHECFHFINDAGHCENGLYALKANYQVAGLDLESLKSFRSMESPLTGHGEAHLFPQGVFVSNGPLGSGLPQAQGLAAAESMAAAPRITVTAISDGGCMEGEAKEALAAIPGLAEKGRLGPFLCIISDNNTKLSGRIDQDSFSMQPTFQSLQDLGWDVKFVEDGHQLQEVYQSIEESVEKLTKDSSRPQLLWLKTIKGKGVKKAEESDSGGHGFPLKKPADIGEFVREIYRDQNTPEAIDNWVTQLASYEKSATMAPRFPGERMKVQVGVSEALIEKYQNGFPVVSISSDLQGSTGVAGFRKKFPEASFEVGVAEANMISMAIGLSKSGYIPVVDTFSQFAVTKGALPLIMSGLSQGPMIGVFSHTGFQDAADGASHQALTYFAMTASIPNVDVYVLSCRQEAFQLLGQAIEKFANDRKNQKVPRSQIFFSRPRELS